MSENSYPQRKKIRLDSAIYSEQAAICSITIALLNRTPLFTDHAFTHDSISLLRLEAETTGVAVHAYCFMPDHLHLLLSPSPQVSLIDFLRALKGRSTRMAWQYGYQGKIWQRSFYDHFLRKGEDVHRVVEYILNNPVRQEMVNDWQEYPFSGSLVYNIKE